MPARSEPDTPPIESDALPGIAHPRETTSLHGQDAALELVATALTGGKLPHGWLIGGPEGIGKATLAYRIAKLVLAAGAGPIAVHPTLESDAENSAVRLVTRGAHPDLCVLRRPTDERTGAVKTVIPVDEVRRLQGFFAHHASAGGWRIAIVDSVDELNRNAANALLKILEEPPPRTLLFLISHAPGRALPTIRSRCRRLTLQPLSDEALQAVLRDKGVTLDADRARLVGWLSGGSARRALDWAIGDTPALYEDLSTLLADLPRLDIDRLHALADRANARGDDQVFATLTELMNVWLEHLIRTAATGTPPVDADARDQETMTRLAAACPLDGWLAAWDKVRGTFEAGGPLNMDRKALVLTAFLTLQATARGAA